VSSGRFLIKSTEEYLPQGLVTPSRKDKEAKKSMLNLFPTSQSLKILEQKRDRESSKLKLFSPSFRKIIKNNMTGNPYSINQVFFFLLLYWGYIVAFTKVLTIYQLHHTGIYPLHYSPFPTCTIPGIVSTGLIFPIINMYTMETFSLSSNRNGVMPIYVLVQFCFPFRE
jgi:hypothetical protein